MASARDDYRQLAKVLLGVDCLHQSPLLLPSLYGDPPRVNIGDLTDEDDQALSRIICQRFPGMSASHWATLNEPQRIAWMDRVAETMPQRPDNEPPHDLLGKLADQEQKIISFMWNRESATAAELESHLAKKPRTPDALRQAINRLQKKLRRYPRVAIDVVLRRQMVYLSRKERPV